MATRPYSAVPTRGPASTRPARASSAAPRLARPLSAHVPAPRPLPTTLSSSMQKTMSEITFKAPPPPPCPDPRNPVRSSSKATMVPRSPPKPQQQHRPAASGGRPGSAAPGASAPGVVGGKAVDKPRVGHKIMHGIGPDLGYYVWEAPRSEPDENGRRHGVHPGRHFGSTPPQDGERNWQLRQVMGNSAAPPDGERHPQDSGAFERLLPHEAADRLAGVGGTTLPSAENLTYIRDQFYMQQEQYREEQALAKAAAAREKRARAERARQMHLPSSVKSKFSWGSERISHALLTKLDAFTARNEDYTRKLLWTLGTDEALTGGGSQIRITPANMPRMCDRFGIACTPEQATEIFERHALPSGGCSVQQLTKTFIESKVDIPTMVRDQARRLHGDAARPPAALRMKTPLKPEPPHAHAHVLANTWSKQTEMKQAAVAGLMVGGGGGGSGVSFAQQPPAPVPMPTRAASAGAVRSSSVEPYAGMAGGSRQAAYAVARLG